MRRVLVTLLGLVGCGSTASQNVARDSGAVGPDGAAIDPGLQVKGPIDGTLALIARGYANQYQAWGRVDDELRWAPTLCRMPLPARARASTSMDADTHGQKLYSVFAKHHAAYPDGPHDDQVVVKESWTAEPVTDGTTYQPGAYGGGDHFYPYAMKDGALYRASARAGLYLMFKLDPLTPNSDAGWVYATVDVQGQVTSAGRVPSCMGCHVQAAHERLFGVSTGL